MLVRKLTKDPTDLYGLTDRGVLAAGRRAYLNAIDYSQLAVGQVGLVGDLPGGAKRFLQQDARGYALTIVNGIVTGRDARICGFRVVAIVVEAIRTPTDFAVRSRIGRATRLGLRVALVQFAALAERSSSRCRRSSAL